MLGADRQLPLIAARNCSTDGPYRKAYKKQKPEDE
jgi:hypothetical protein